MTGNKPIGIPGGSACSSGPRRANGSTNVLPLGGVFCIDESQSAGTYATTEDADFHLKPVLTANIANGHQVVVLNKDIPAGGEGPCADGDDIVVPALVLGPAAPGDALVLVNAQPYLAKASTADTKIHGRARGTPASTATATLTEVRFWSEGKAV